MLIKKDICKIIIILLLTSVFCLSVCDDFMEPLVPFIDLNTGSARGLGYYIFTPNFYNETEDFIAIPPNEVTIISIPVFNPVRYDLELSLKGRIDSETEIELNESKDTVTVKIKNPVRLGIFKMVLEISALGRDMVPYSLPKMQARHFDTSLASLESSVGVLSPAFNPSSMADNYTLFVPYGIDSAVITASVPDGVFSKLEIIYPDNFLTGDILVKVKADSGEKKTYAISMKVGLDDSKELADFSFGIAGEVIVIDEDALTIDVILPYGTNVTSLTPVVAHTGISYTPQGAQNFSSPVTYTITAMDGSTAEYLVTVIVEPSNQFTITYNQIVDLADGIIDPGIVLYLGGYGGDQIKRLTVPAAGFDIVEFYQNGIKLTCDYDGTTYYIDLDAAVHGNNLAGKHTITVVAHAGTMQYSKVIAFTVVNEEPAPFAGLGTAASPYLIGTVEDLYMMEALINSDASYRSANYKLTADINLPVIAAGSNWNPIGNFIGVFDGGGFVIKNLTIKTTNSNQGFFSTIGDNSVIKNIGLVNVDIQGGVNTGGIVGNSYEFSLIENCFVTGTIVSTANRVGGISGYSDGTIQYCYTICDVTGTGDVGGISGWQRRSGIYNCVSLGLSVSGTDPGRIYGTNGVSSTNNYSREDMLVKGTKVNDTNTAAKHGADINDSTNLTDSNGGYHNQSFWQNTVGFDFSTVWDWNDTTNLPVLQGFSTAQNHTVP